MPIRSYTNINLSNISETGESVINGSLTGTGFNRVGSGSSVGLSEAIINITADIDFAGLFPTIPASATITKVEINIENSASATGTGATYILGPILYRGFFVAVLASSRISGSAPGSITAPTNFIDLTSMTRATLISLYGTLTVAFAARSTGNGADLATCALTTSNFTLTVTYDLENYSWYIKPTVRIVNGQKVTIIEDDVTDIIVVLDGEEPPVVGEGELPYEFYGTGEDYPDGPTYVWWESPDFWEFFIFSPISPNFGPIESWVNIGAANPCPTCGTFTVGALDVLAADASGVYVLTPNKGDDTIYDRESSSTVDVQIPNPFIKTGFIP